MAVIEQKSLEVSNEYKSVIELLKDAILNKHLVRFYYESENGNKGFRTIPPYMMILNKNGLELVGVPVEELTNSGKPRHYTIVQLAERLKLKQLQILPKTFTDPGVPRNIVLYTGVAPVCRFIYEDENPKQVRTKWMRVKYINKKAS